MNAPAYAVSPARVPSEEVMDQVITFVNATSRDQWTSVEIPGHSPIAGEEYLAATVLTFPGTSDRQAVEVRGDFAPCPATDEGPRGNRYSLIFKGETYSGSCVTGLFVRMCAWKRGELPNL